MTPLVSVVIPFHNSAAWIREALASVVSQTWNDHEIIAIDDGSTDATADIVREEFASVTLIRTPNRGVSAARNLGTTLCRGSYIQYLDSDDVLLPGAIAAHVTVLERSRADIAYGDWQFIDAASPPTFGDVVRRVLTEPEVNVFNDLWCPLGAYLFRREIVKKVGGWNERFAIIADARLIHDCVLSGAKVVHSPGIAAYYRVVPGSLSRRDRVARLRELHRNAVETRAYWEANGGLTASRRRALVESFAHGVRSSCDNDRNLYEQALSQLESLDPSYVPKSPGHLKLAAKALGYRRAEFLARAYRRATSWCRPHYFQQL